MIVMETGGGIDTIMLRQCFTVVYIVKAGTSPGTWSTPGFLIGAVDCLTEGQCEEIVHVLINL